MLDLYGGAKEWGRPAPDDPEQLLEAPAVEGADERIPATEAVAHDFRNWRAWRDASGLRLGPSLRFFKSEILDVRSRATFVRAGSTDQCCCDVAHHMVDADRTYCRQNLAGRASVKLKRLA